MGGFKSKEEERAYHRAWYRKRKQEAIEQLGGECVQCGATENLEFDHIDPSTKTAVVTVILRKNPKRLQEELSKCQLLCHDCHKRKSIAEAGKRPAKGTHGTLSSRRYCSCRRCVEAKSRYMREWKRNRRAFQNRAKNARDKA